MFRKRPRRAIALALTALLIVSGAYLFLTPLSTQRTTVYIHLRQAHDLDAVCAQLDSAAAPRTLLGFRVLSYVLGLEPRLQAGRYALPPSASALQLVRTLRNHQQAPVRLTLNNLRTTGDLAARLAAMLASDSAAWMRTFSSPDSLAAAGVTPATLPAIVHPDTYEVYWTITPAAFLQKMRKADDQFWAANGRAQALRESGLSKAEVSSLASIVQQETAARSEKPAVAAMYLNRLHIGMKLQADPTVKFALGNFSLRRILHEHLLTPSPYNTYLNHGLPPGPIAFPEAEDIDAVLHPAPHNYIYMCARENFSGTHRFAATYAEHMQNARRYAAALNARGIR